METKTTEEEKSLECDITGLNFNDTELTLRLPGEPRPPAATGRCSAAKRGFPETVICQSCSADEESETEVSSTGRKLAAKAQVVGWPPVRWFRKKALKTCTYVKVAVDGAPYLRKVDLEVYLSYQELLRALQEMFTCFTISSNYPKESKLMDWVNGFHYVPTYEDKDGDWMLVGDVPWKMFKESCKRIRLVKSSHSLGLDSQILPKCTKATQANIIDSFPPAPSLSHRRLRNLLSNQVSIFVPRTAKAKPRWLFFSHWSCVIMLKQILGKLPRKSSKPDSFDSAGSNSVNLGTGIQFTNGCNVVSGRLNVVKRMSSAIFPASIAAGVEAVEPHIPFKDVSNSEKQYLFVSKLNLCCSVYDFRDPDDNSTEKDLKRQTLIELVDFVASGSAKFTESAIAAMCKMCAINLFREFPPKYRSRCTRDETEDEEPMFDPAWSHLQLVYDLLLRFVSYNSLDAKVAKKYIDHLFIVRLLDLFDSEDPRERDCLKTILHRIYGKFMVHRPFIRKAVSNIIYRFVFETERHNGIAELLEIFGSVISGFAIPLKEEHKIFLCRALIPLHKPKSVGIYHQQLTYCVVQFVEKEPKLACTVIKGLLKYWPLTNSQKELMFLSELEELLEMINMAEFEKIMVPLFRRVACCLTSYHFQVTLTEEHTCLLFRKWIL
ncbi:hypothetical protein F0562_030016 [Nyssa sinensis]|uniref:Auxin-responsive protein n=1 Tax=Nyssa sinensis TaxID=561372 RepID=A0A5J5AVT5_9ASTE|nr:hypothetical protein F0562_030016 [Nyssa sinensis]